MLNFDFYSPTRIIFGKGTSDDVGALIAPIAKKVLIHYGSERIKESGLLSRITNSLEKSGVSYVLLGGVRPNPDVALAKEGVKLCQREGVELILCVGGGSVIDSGKAIGLGLYHPELDLWSIYEKGLETKGMAKVACVLTFPASGSESSNSTVISNYETHQKCGYNREWNRPLLAIIDPTLFASIPKFQIACGVADMMSHVFERYFSATPDTELSDALCEATLKTLLAFGPAVVDDPADYHAWCQVSLSGTLAHDNVLGVGRAQDWACHKLDHELTARFGVTHGAGLAVLFPQWIRHVWRKNPSRFEAFARNVMGVEQQTTVSATIEAGVCALEAFFERLGLPKNLVQMGVEPSSAREMAKCVVYAADGSERVIGALMRLHEDDVTAIFEAAMR